ncbi:MAG: hypothetical protein ACRD38_00485 [Nitrososphaerales archaeon]
MADSSKSVVTEVPLSNLQELMNKLNEVTSRLRYELPYSVRGVQRQRNLAKREKDALILQIKEKLNALSKEEADRIKSRLYDDLGIYI